MKDKDLLIEAIENYDIYQPQGRAVLKTLVAAANENNTVYLSMTHLSQLSKVSRQGLYTIIYSLEKDNILERSKENYKLFKFILHPSRLEEILEYFKNLAAAKNFLKI